MIRPVWASTGDVPGFGAFVDKLDEPVVDADPVALLEQQFNEVFADESGVAGDENPMSLLQGR